ncbi:MAG: DEAD/DEAH box helicase [Alphaproteobacteria bacterium]
MSATALPKIQLRPYQTKALNDVRQAFRRDKRVLLQLPTGAGKTVCFTSIAKGAAAKGKRILTLAHRVELVEQACAKYAMMGIETAMVGRDIGWQEAPIAVAMAQTASKLDLPDYDLIVLDEAHHCVGRTWSKVLNRFPDAYHLGVTATPRRLDGKGLDKHYDALVQGPTVKELTAQGHLAPINAYHDAGGIVAGLRGVGDQDPADFAQIVAEHTEGSIGAWRDKAFSLPTIAFTASRRHGEFVRDRFIEAGVTAVFVDGNMPMKERKQALADYAEGRATVLVSVDLISEGFDCPETAAILAMRSTGSLTMWFQMIGRGMRPKTNGGPMVLLDMAGNAARLGLPSDIVQWDLTGKAKTEEQVQREFERAAEKEREQEAIARHSGRVVRIAETLEDAVTFKDARRFLKRPRDLLVIKNNCRRRDGKKYSDAFLIRFAAEEFFADRPWQQALLSAGNDLGKRSYVERALKLGLGWTVPPSQDRAA